MMHGGPASEPGELLVEDRIAWLRLGDRERKVNTLSSRLLAWLEQQLARLEHGQLDGLVILSGKPDGFAAGADLGELAGLAARPAEVLALVERGHQALGRLAALPFPTVAAIHGACLGGGLELALACSRRVATDAATTRLGLPEVQLGLIPGLGGTQRLPRLVGVTAALDLIASGRRLDARQAERIGLVDEVCSVTVLAAAAARQLELAAPATVGRTGGGGTGGTAPGARRGRPKPPLLARTADRLARLPLLGAPIWRRARRRVRERAGRHYPAPRVALEIVRRGLRLPLDRALELEAGAFMELASSAQARNLIALFFIRREVEARAEALARAAHPVRSVAVIGAGLMGGGIAQVLAEPGVQVVLKDRDQATVGRGMAVIAANLRRRSAGRRTGEAESDTILARIRPTLRADALRQVELVIEAVFEDLAIKQAVLREVESQVREGVVFASNTSSIPIARIAEAATRSPVVGMHFFSPVPRMPLLEVVRHRGSGEAAVATAAWVGRKMRKTPIVVEDGPGFFTTRVLAPLLNEAAWLLAGGARRRAGRRRDGGVGLEKQYKMTGGRLGARPGAARRRRARAAAAAPGKQPEIKTP
jgi:3-hydroxyacyl-CoA dehydrogenase/enoyl-CoA hydratase/3-hydroxybutyryl-CoA epimerase